MRKGKHSPLHIFLVVWLIITSLYFVYNEWGRLNTVMQRSREDGFATAINGILQNAQSCEPFNVYSGEVSVDLINIECLNQGDGQAQNPQQ